MGRRKKKPTSKYERKEKSHFKEIVKENESYHHYYKEQQCFETSEFNEFWNSIKLPLPAVFRISGYKKHSKQLLKNIKQIHFKEMKDLTIDDELIKPPSSLPWYPDEFAWKTELNRSQIRKVPQLQKFHAFLIAETESGHITRQEAVSMIPPLMLDIQPKHKVLDMCAAPGSKTAQIIELLNQDDNVEVPEGLCIANDKDNKRCYMLVHQMNRLNSPSAIIVNHDAATFPEIIVKNSEGIEEELRYDRVLCDVPCSGDGTIRKNTDVWIKWSIANAIYLHNIQLRILMRGLQLLAVGGKLVYSTCSLNPIEDEAVIAAALAKCAGTVQLLQSNLPGLKWSPGVSSWRVMDRQRNWYKKHSELPDDIKNISKTMFPPEDDQLVKGMNLDRCMRLLPHHQDTGGFFVAVLCKNSLLPWQKEKPKNNSTTDNKDSTKRPEASTELPPKKKPRWGPGFKEDPFVFFGEKEKSIIEQLKVFYGLNSFPFHQLLTRTTQEKKKHLYFVSNLVKNVVENNSTSLKIVNTGIRAFSRCDNSQHDLQCSFRIVQDGVEYIEPFMTRQVVKIDLDDVVGLLIEEQPTFVSLSSSLRDQLKTIDPGSIVYKYIPPDKDAPVSCDLLMCGWKGYAATRLYMCRNERMHFLHLCGHPVPDHLLPNKSSRRARAEVEIPPSDNNGTCDNTQSSDTVDHLTEQAADDHVTEQTIGDRVTGEAMDAAARN